MSFWTRADDLLQALLRSLHFRLGRFIRVEPERDVGDTFPDGHFHSPLPVQAAALDYIHSRTPASSELKGIDLNRDQQVLLLNQFAAFHADLPFPHEPTPGCRYWYRQDWLGQADAIYLYCLLRHFRPQRIIEVGSGFSSAVIMETIDRHLSPPPRFSMIEPHPERLRSIIPSSDLQRFELLETEVQHLSPELFRKLACNDLLYIDSSHVLKCGSDLHFLLFEVLPIVQEGVIVHFHDVFYPFEYPADWIRAGRYWNECYLLYAFLFNNPEWEILLFADYLAQFHRTDLQRCLPLALENTGGSLFLRRKIRNPNRL